MNDDVGEPMSLLTTPDEREAAVDAQARARATMQRADQEWDRQHAESAAQLERELLADAPDVGRDHGLLLHLAVQEAALAGRLTAIELQLLGRLDLLTESPASALKLAKVIKETVAISAVITGRVEKLLTSASIIRAQRELTRTRPGLRRVA